MIIRARLRLAGLLAVCCVWSGLSAEQDHWTSAADAGSDPATCTRIGPAPEDLWFEARSACRAWSPRPYDRFGTRAVAELTGDGRADVIFSERGSYDARGLSGWWSLGQGDFAALNLPLPPLRAPGPGAWMLRVAGFFATDVDADGRADVLALVSIDDTSASGSSPLLHRVETALALGGGRFAPWTASELGPAVSSTVRRATTGDFDGDGRPDLALSLFRLAGGGDRLLEVWLRREAGFEPAGTVSIGDAGEPEDWLIAADVDGDGLDDLVYGNDTDPAYSVRSVRLFLRRATGGGAFAEAREIAGWGEPRDLLRVNAADLDGDGRTDLFLQLAREGLDRANATLRGDGRGGFEAIWRGPEQSEALGAYRLADVDLDGYFDLVETVADWSDPVRWFHVRRGLGNGAFGEREGPWTRGLFRDEPLADFTGDGQPDLLALIGRYGSYRSCLLEGSGRRAAQDAEPPRVELLLWPEVVNFAGPARQPDRTWRVSAAASDDCLRTRVLSRRLDLPALDSLTTPVFFRRAARHEVRIYEVPGSGHREVLLLGPQEDLVRAAFDAARASGGYALRNAHPLSILVLDEYGPAPDSGDPLSDSTRLLTRIALGDDGPTRAQHTGPGDLFFTVRAEDETGNEVASREGFAAARARYCAAPRAAARACRD